MANIPDNSIDFSISSPPFVGLYKFSSSDRDISNNEGDQFWLHYSWIIRETLRIMKPGRLCSIHCMQLPRGKGKDGYIGMYDFRGDIIRAFEREGWHFASEVCIWKDPVVAQQRTKSIRLLHKQVIKDAALSGQGLADYIVTFRKPGDNDKPIAGCFNQWIGEGDGPDFAKYTTDTEGRNWYSIEVWQRFASPVWTDINQTRTLQYRGGRDEKDEVHISPLQLDVIERCIVLWSNPGETVFTPFLGIGSEVYGAVELGRKGIGIELKPSYFKQAVKNLEGCGIRRPDLFGEVA
jgi:hypothetical protein